MIFVSNDSCHSTVTAEDGSDRALRKSQQRRSGGRRHRRRKLVRFNEGLNRHYATHNQNAEDVWYSSKDFKMQRQEAKSTLRRVLQAHIEQEKKTKSQDQHDEENQEDLCSSPSHILGALYQAAASVTTFVPDASHVVTPTLERALEHLYDKESEEEHEEGTVMMILGLECHLVDFLTANHLRKRRNTLHDVVQDIQSEYRRGLWTADTVQVEFRDSCLACTQAPSLLAQLVGRAQAAHAAIDDASA